MVTTLEIKQGHRSVMVAEVLNGLSVRSGGRYLDCTLGPGGHAEAILITASPGGHLLGLDADQAAISTARQRLQAFSSEAQLVHANFRDLAKICSQKEFRPVDGILFDLGISSLQLADTNRGFGFQVEAPLDMRFGRQQGTAADIVNNYPEDELADLIWQFGEERGSRKIARAIAAARPIQTTTELSVLIQRTLGARPQQRIHPATRTFQALRIAVNEELSTLSIALEDALTVLASRGRLVVISFHSLEDRIVKQFIERESRDCLCPPEIPICTCSHRATLRRPHKRPLRPSEAEVEANPRSRSARLRTAEKI